MKLKEQEKVEIRFSGTGGQGLVLASIILAEALMMDGFNIITGESHGIEARGGASSAEISLLPYLSKHMINMIKK
jgi:2-oxoglutarate ferredoxin oxidoreductase subunit gamma